MAQILIRWILKICAILCSSTTTSCSTPIFSVNLHHLREIHIGWYYAPQMARITAELVGEINGINMNCADFNPMGFKNLRYLMFIHNHIPQHTHIQRKSAPSAGKSIFNTEALT